MQSRVAREFYQITEFGYHLLRILQLTAALELLANAGDADAESLHQHKPQNNFQGKLRESLTWTVGMDGDLPGKY